MPRAVLGDPNENTRESDRFLENGNFVTHTSQIACTGQTGRPAPTMATL